jgi:hypothetical protein
MHSRSRGIKKDASEQHSLEKQRASASRTIFQLRFEECEVNLESIEKQ